MKRREPRTDPCPPRNFACEERIRHVIKKTSDCVSYVLRLRAETVIMAILLLCIKHNTKTLENSTNNTRVNHESEVSHVAHDFPV